MSGIFALLSALFWILPRFWSAACGPLPLPARDFFRPSGDRHRPSDRSMPIDLDRSRRARRFPVTPDHRPGHPRPYRPMDPAMLANSDARLFPRSHTGQWSLVPALMVACSRRQTGGPMVACSRADGRLFPPSNRPMDPVLFPARIPAVRQGDRGQSVLPVIASRSARVLVVTGCAPSAIRRAYDGLAVGITSGVSGRAPAFAVTLPRWAARAALPRIARPARPLPRQSCPVPVGVPPRRV